MRKTVKLCLILIGLVMVCSFIIPITRNLNLQLAQDSVTREIQLPTGPINIRQTIIVQGPKLNTKIV